MEDPTRYVYTYDKLAFAVVFALGVISGVVIAEIMGRAL